MTDNSNSNWTFIGLNFHLMKGDSKVQQHQDSRQFQYPGIRTRWVCLGVQLGFELLSERG